MIEINHDLQPADLLPKIEALWDASAGKIRSIEQTCPPGSPSPVFTRAGKYTAQGWTAWTQGFQYGSAILQFDATGDAAFVDLCPRTSPTWACTTTGSTTSAPTATCGD